jgi:hypothetical protein
LITVICALALFVESAALTADALTGFGAGMAPGARKSTGPTVLFVTGWQGFEPATQIWPRFALPPAIPLTLHITAMFELPFTCAVSVTR